MSIKWGGPELLQFGFGIVIYSWHLNNFIEEHQTCSMVAKILKGQQTYITKDRLFVSFV